MAPLVDEGPFSGPLPLVEIEFSLVVSVDSEQVGFVASSEFSRVEI